MTDTNDKGQTTAVSIHSNANEAAETAPIVDKLLYSRKKNGETRFEANGRVAILAGALLVLVPVIVVVLLRG